MNTPTSSFVASSQIWPAGAFRLWAGPVDDRPRTVQFRRTFDLPARPDRAELLLWAEGRFHLWINGRYVTRGPLLHHPDRRAVLPLDLTHHLSAGRNVIAVLAQSPGTSLQNFVWSGEPGPVASLEMQRGSHATRIFTDAQWRCRVAREWLTEVPRRGWATAWIEVCDAAQAEFDWHQEDFEDAPWQRPDLLPPSAFPHMIWEHADVPGVIAGEEVLVGPVTIYHAPARVPALERSQPSSAFGQALLEEPWERWSALERQSNLLKETRSVTLKSLRADQGVALVFDHPLEVTGQVMFDLQAESSGVVEIAYSEVFHNDRPWMMLKGNSYADRLIARAGSQRWEPVNYSAFRYAALVLRGFTGDVKISNVSIRATQMNLDFSRATFRCDDDDLDSIWHLCMRTLAISAQEGLTDCPTREQAVYAADAPLVGRWIATLTGDVRPWRHTMREVFIRPGANGLIKDAVYAPTLRTLADFNLVAVHLLADYAGRSGDVGLVQQVLPAAENAVRWFLNQRDASGLVNIDWAHMRTREPESERVYTGQPLGQLTPWLFIDHPGMGWHNVGEPGIDRRGLSGALHAWLTLACEAIASLHEQVGQHSEAQLWRTQAQEIRSITARTFFDPQRGAFSDSLHEGKLSSQHSQQTNTAALLARCVQAADVSMDVQRRIEQVLNYAISPDADAAHNGPYYWAYLLEVLEREDRVAEAIAAIRKHWKPMVLRGASTVWETFAGDHLDSWCHPWSAAPAAFLACVVLGLRPPRTPQDHWRIKPRYDLLSRASGSLPIPGSRDCITLAWQPHGSQVELKLHVPDGVPYDLIDIAGRLIVTPWATPG